MGASALLIVFIVLMGYISNRYSQVKHHKLLQYTGQHLYNKLIANGVVCFVLGLGYCNLVEHWQPGVLKHNDYIQALNILTSTFSETVFASVIVGVSLAFLWALSHDLLQQAIFLSQTPKPQFKSKYWVGRRFEAWKRYANYIRHNEAAASDPIRAQIIHSVSTERLMMIFMSDRKVYIGQFEGALFSNDFREQLTHCKFVPNKSGYREKDTLEVEITTKYKLKQLPTPTLKRVEGLAVILKISDIVSIREYNDEQFENFIKMKERADREERLMDLISLDAKDYLVAKQKAT